MENVDEDDVISAQAMGQNNWGAVSKAIPINFFERVVSMLPMHVPYMTNKDLVTTLEVMVKRNLGQQEMMAGLLELSKRDKKKEHDWNINPITAKCVQIYTEKVRGYNSKRTIQGILMLHMLRLHNA